MRLDFPELAVRRFMAGGLDIHGTSRIADRRAFVTAEVAKVEEVAPDGGGVIQEELGETTEPDVMFEDDDEDWDIDGIMSAKELEASALQGKISVLRKKYFSASGKVSVDILTVVALAEQTLHLEHQVTKWE